MTAEPQASAQAARASALARLDAMISALTQLGLPHGQIALLQHTRAALAAEDAAATLTIARAMFGDQALRAVATGDASLPELQLEQLLAFGDALGLGQPFTLDLDEGAPAAPADRASAHARLHALDDDALAALDYFAAFTSPVPLIALAALALEDPTALSLDASGTMAELRRAGLLQLITLDDPERTPALTLNDATREALDL